MVEYLARYTTYAAKCDSGEFMPDSEPHKNEYRFDAPSKSKAKKMANEHISVIGKQYFGANTTLDSLLEVKDVRLK